MRIKSNLPIERVKILRILRLYVAFLILASILSALILGYYLLELKIKEVFVYLFGVFFFVSSSILYLDFYRTIKVSRFSTYWKFFRTYSPPLGGYAFFHLTVGLILLIADTLKGTYMPLATMIIFKAIFEYELSRTISSLSLASLLYDELDKGTIYKLLYMGFK